MSNTIKIEFDCPEFNSELEINIVIRKDGKGAVESTTVSYPDPKNTMTENKKETTEVQEKPKKVSKKKEKPTQITVGDNLDSEAKVYIDTNSETTEVQKTNTTNPANGRFITGDELESMMNGGGNFMNLTF